MLNFLNDYNSLAHPKILAALSEISKEKFSGYSTDDISTKARASLANQIGRGDLDIHFLPGGTLTNLTAISAFLRPYEAVISVYAAHIYMHETGAIEASGHKILTANSADGKLYPHMIENILREHVDEHMVKPRLVFISQATESGMVYSRSELAAIREVCIENKLLLYVDGARLGYALTAKNCGISLGDLAKLTDAFYIGGTKNGLLFGEALVICKDELKQDFRYSIKQRGGLLAKGFLISKQFETIFEDGLYFSLAEHSNKLAGLLTDELLRKNYRLEFDTQTNQVFPIITNEQAEELENQVLFERWHDLGETEISIRFVTSWATVEQEIEDLCRLL